MTEKIKFVKYSNRRIYDIGVSSYVPFSGIKNHIMNGYAVEIIDKKNEDLARDILISILLENGRIGERGFF